MRGTTIPENPSIYKVFGLLFCQKSPKTGQNVHSGENYSVAASPDIIADGNFNAVLIAKGTGIRVDRKVVSIFFDLNQYRYTGADLQLLLNLFEKINLS